MIVTTRCGGVPGKDSERFANQVGRGHRPADRAAAGRSPAPGPGPRRPLPQRAGGGRRCPRSGRPAAGIRCNEGRNINLHPQSRPIALDLVEEREPGLPYSSRSIQVDHDRCILCDRCVRSCSDVKPFQVIGHTGKGYRTRISFDLDQLMNESSCVQCGECMTSCPTGALTLNRRVNPLRSFADAEELERQVPARLPPAGRVRARTRGWPTTTTRPTRCRRTSRPPRDAGGRACRTRRGRADAASGRSRVSRSLTCGGTRGPSASAASTPGMCCAGKGSSGQPRSCSRTASLRSVGRPGREPPTGRASWAGCSAGAAAAGRRPRCSPPRPGGT